MSASTFVCPGCDQPIATTPNDQIPWHLDAPMSGCRTVGFFVVLDNIGAPDLRALRRMCAEPRLRLYSAAEEEAEIRARLRRERSGG